MEWTMKYAPKKPNEYVGIKSNIQVMSKFLESFIDDNPISKGIILYGEPGNGKTSLLYALESTYNLKIIEVNASNKRNSKDIKSLISTSGNNAFDDEFLVILLDEFDGINAWDALETLLEQSRCPIVLTCNDIDVVPYEIMKECTPLEISPPPEYKVVDRLEEILKKEKIKKYDKKILNEITEKCISMRSSILTLQQYIMTGNNEIIPYDIDYSERQQIKRLFEGKEGYFNVEPEKVSKWAKANGVPIYDLDKLIKSGKEYPNMQEIIKEYSKTLRGNIDKLKSPYYTRFKKTPKSKNKEIKKKFKAKEERPKEAERRLVIQNNTMDDENLW